MLFDYLPENERKAVWAIYAVCRIIDDSIDVHENPQILKNIHDDIITIEKNHDVENYEFKSNQMIMEALYTVSQNFTIEYQSFIISFKLYMKTRSLRCLKLMMNY